jgi:hypothetical protein
LIDAARRWTILRIMAVIAVLAPLLALSRYPFYFGLFLPVGLIALFVTLSIRRRRYDWVAWLIIAYPLIPLLTLYLHGGLIQQKLSRRSSPFFEGLIGLSDVCALLFLLAYVACVSLVAGVAAELVRDNPTLKRAAWRVVILMPISWVVLFVVAVWDPFGMLGHFFR